MKDNKNESAVQPGFIKGFSFEAIRLASLGGVIAAGFLPLDYLSHCLQTPGTSLKGTRYSMLPLSLSYTAAKAMLKAVSTAYGHSVKAATIKNGMLEQRNNVQAAITSKKSEELSHEEEKNVPQTTTAQALTIFTLTGAATTTATHIPRVNRTLNFQKVKDSTFVLPEMSKYKDYFKIMRVGYLVCLASNSLTVAGFYLTPKLKELYSTKMPEKMAEFGAVMTLAGFIGPFTNCADIIFKNQAIRMNPKTKKAPSAKQVAKELIAKEGIRFAKRGLKTSIIYTAFAFFFVPRAEKLVDEKVMPMVVATFYNTEKILKNCKSTFFQYQTAFIEKKKAQRITAEKNKENDNNKKSGPKG